LTEKIRCNGLSLAATASKSLTSLFSLKDRSSPKLLGRKDHDSRKSSSSLHKSSSTVTEDTFYDCEANSNRVFETGLMEMPTDKKCQITLLTSRKTLNSQILKQLRKKFTRETLLESVESIEKNIFYNIQYDEGDIQNVNEINKLYILSTSCYEELSLFAPILLPSAPNFSVLMMTFKWTDEDDTDYFINNWTQLCGLGNLLSHLLAEYQIGQVKFMKKKTIDFRNHYGEKRSEKENMCPTFIVTVEVFHEENQFINLVDYVQRTRERRNTGHLGIYFSTQL